MEPLSPTYNRKNIRLKDYDYSRAGSYFVTICARNHKSFFGVLLGGEMYLNTEGQIVIECWKSLSERFPGVSLDEYVLMPNHMHGIINIADNKGVINHEGVINHAPTEKTAFVGAQFIAPPIHYAQTLGMIVRAFKALATRQIRLSGIKEFGWQHNYYEHIIRNEDSLDRIRKYIKSNPLRWEIDRENPNRKGEDEFDRWLNHGAINSGMINNGGVMNHEGVINHAPTGRKY